MAALVATLTVSVLAVQMVALISVLIFTKTAVPVVLMAVPIGTVTPVPAPNYANCCDTLAINSKVTRGNEGG